MNFIKQEGDDIMGHCEICEQDIIEDGICSDCVEEAQEIGIKILQERKDKPQSSIEEYEKSRERQCLEKLMEMLYGNRQITLKSDFEKPYELTFVELSTEKEDYGQPQSQVHTHCSVDTHEEMNQDSIDMAVESFINHIIGDKGGLNWHMDFEKVKEPPHKMEE